jgi:hypothetical protein
MARREQPADFTGQPRLRARRTPRRGLGIAGSERTEFSDCDHPKRGRPGHAAKRRRSGNLYTEVESQTKMPESIRRVPMTQEKTQPNELAGAFPAFNKGPTAPDSSSIS